MAKKTKIKVTRIVEPGVAESKQMKVGQVVLDFFESLIIESAKRGASSMSIVEKKDRFSISIDDVATAAILKRVDSLAVHLSKFKPYATSLDLNSANLVSYGAAGYFLVGPPESIEKVVEFVLTHHDDLKKRIKVKGGV